jgi:hypothetical protein
MNPPPRLLLLTLLGACASGGALRQTAVARDCGTNDPGCHRIGPLAPLAVGAVFRPDVAVELPGTTAPALTLASVDQRVLDVVDGALVGVGPGVSAVTIAVDTGAVVDFIHVWVATPTAVTLQREGGERVETAIQLVAGEDLKLVPALWNRGQRLEGASSVEWSLECEAACPAALLRDGSPHRRRLRAQRPGKATLVVAGLGVRATLAVEVVP